MDVKKEVLETTKRWRNEKIEIFLKRWLNYFDWQDVKELSLRLGNFSLELSEEDDILKLGREFKKKVEELDGLEAEIKELYKDWRCEEKPRYDERDDKEQEEIHKRAYRLIDDWTEKYSRIKHKERWLG